MSDEDYWQLFKDTGDPLCWLMSRGGGGGDSAGEPEEDKDGVQPSA